MGTDMGTLTEMDLRTDVRSSRRAFQSTVLDDRAKSGVFPLIEICNAGNENFKYLRPVICLRSDRRRP